MIPTSSYRSSANALTPVIIERERRLVPFPCACCINETEPSIESAAFNSDIVIKFWDARRPSNQTFIGEKFLI